MCFHYVSITFIINIILVMIHTSGIIAFEKYSGENHFSSATGCHMITVPNGISQYRLPHSLICVCDSVAIVDRKGCCHHHSRSYIYTCLLLTVLGIPEVDFCIYSFRKLIPIIVTLHCIAQ